MIEFFHSTKETITAIDDDGFDVFVMSRVTHDGREGDWFVDELAGQPAEIQFVGFTTDEVKQMLIDNTWKINDSNGINPIVRKD